MKRKKILNRKDTSKKILRRLGKSFIKTVKKYGKDRVKRAILDN